MSHTAVRLCVVFAAAAFSAPLYATASTQTEIRSVGPFDSISSHGNMDIDVTLGGPSKVTVEGQGDALSRISTEVESGTLLIAQKRGSGCFLFCGERPHVVVRVTAPRLRAIEQEGSGNLRLSGTTDGTLSVDMSGSGNIAAQGSAGSLQLLVNGSGDAHFEHFAAGTLDIHMRGSGNLFAGGHAGTVELRMASSGDAALEHLDADSVNVDMAGAGDVSADGRTRSLKLRIAGSGDADLAKLAAGAVTVHIFGDGDAHVTADQSLQASINGSGDVIYGGEVARVESQVDGSGEVRRR
jgi:hypothetical protein